MSRATQLLKEEAERQVIYRQLRAKGILLEPLAPEAASQLEAAADEATRLGPLVSFFVDTLELLNANAIVDYWKEHGGIAAMSAQALSEFEAAWERRKLAPLPQPRGEWTAEEIETANHRAVSIFRARFLAPMRVLGNQVGSIVVDAWAGARYEAIRRAWIMPLLALGLGAGSAYAATAFQWGTAAAVTGTTLRTAEATLALSRAARAGTFLPRALPALDTFVGWSSGMFVEPTSQLVAGTAPLAPKSTHLEESKEILMNAAWGLGGKPGAAAGILLIVEFLAGFFGEEHGLVKMIRDRLAETGWFEPAHISEGE